MMKGRIWFFSFLIGITLLFGNILVPRLFLANIARSAGLKDIFIKRLEKNYPIRVYCTAMRYRGGRIELTELRINTLDKKPLLKAPITQIDLDVWRLILHPTSASNAISRLVFLNPSLYLTKDARGEWNFEKLKSDQSQKTEMELKIVVKNGSITIPTDISGWRPGVMDRINGELSLSRNRQMVWKIDGHTRKDEKIIVKSEGSVIPQESSGYMNFQVQNLSLGLIEREAPAKFNPARWGISMLSGKGTADLRLKQTKKGWQFDRAKVGVDNAGARWNKISQPITGVTGGVEILSGSIRANRISGRIGSSIVRLDGETDLTGANPEQQLSIQSNDFQIGVLNKLYPGLSAWKIQGLADIRLRLAILNKKPQLRGEVRLTDASCQSTERKIAFAKIESLLVFNDQGIQLHHLNGYWDDTRLEASGYLRDWNDLHWDVQVKSNRLDITPFVKSFPVKTGELSVKTKIAGPLRQPVLGWEVGTKTWAWKQLEGHDLTAEGSYNLTSGLVKLENLRSGVDDAQLEGKGWVETKGIAPRFNVELWGSSLNISSLFQFVAPEAKKPPVTGIASLKLSGEGRIKDLKSWEIQGTASSSDGSLSMVQYHLLSAKYTYKNGMLHIDQFNMVQGKGKLAASGDWSPASGFQGKVNLDQFGLHLVVPGQVQRDLEGVTSGQFRIAWAKNGDSLDGEGYLDIHQVSLGENKLGDIHLQAKMDKNRLLHLDGSKFGLNQEQSVQISGMVDLKNVPRLELRAFANSINLESLGNWATPNNPVTLNGQASMEVLVNSPLKSLIVQGKLASENLGVSGHRLGDAIVHFDWKDGNLEINEATIKQGQGILSVNGRLGLEGNDLAVKADRYPLNDLSFTLGGVRVQGMVNFDGQMRGDLRNPEMKGILAVRDLNLAGLLFETVDGEIVWKDRTLSAHQVVAARGPQRLVLQGDLKLTKNPYIDLDASLETTRLRELMLVIGLRPMIPMDGNITGNLKLQGPVSSPKIRLKSELNEGFINEYTHLKGILDVEVYDKVYSIHQLELNGPKGALKVNGIYEPEKKAELNLDLTDFDLQPLGAFIKSQDLLEGRLDLQAQLKYGAAGMQGDISARIREGKWRNVLLPFTELNAKVRENILSLSLNQQDIGLVLRGEGPINPKWLGALKLPGTHVNEEAPMHWELSAPEISGNMIEKVWPQAHFTSGNMGAQIVVDGTWQAPNVTGEIYVKHLKGKVDLLPDTFNEMNGQVRINDSKLEIINFDAKYGKGRASVSGGMSLRGLIPDQLDLKIHINRFYYKSSGFESTINSDFKLTGSLWDPLVSGEAVINKSTISIVRAKHLKRFNPRLDILVHSGKENYFRQVGLANILVKGDLHIGGSLTYPEMLGRVNSNRGTLTLYGATFRLKEATAEFDPKNGLFPFITGEAVTRKEKYEISLSARGWTDQTLEMHLDSRPQLTYEEIVSLLHWTDREGGMALLQGNVNAVVDSLLGTRLTWLGNTIGLDYFDIEQDQFSGPFRLNVGKSITNDLYLSYSRTLDPLGEDNWIVEYSLSPNISLLGEYTGEDGTIFQVDFHFHF